MKLLIFKMSSGMQESMRISMRNPPHPGTAEAELDAPLVPEEFCFCIQGRGDGLVL